MSVAGLLTVVIFTFTLVMQEFFYGSPSSTAAATSPSAWSAVVPGARRRLLLGSLMGACFIASVPIRLPVQPVRRPLHRGFTVGAVKGLNLPIPSIRL